MNKFNYILNDVAFDTLVIKCLYAEPTDEDIEECENQIKLLQQENQQLKEDYNKVVHEATEFESKVYELQQRIDKTIEVINTQMKLAEGGTKDNLRIIKFYLIKGECSMYDLTTEEDYKY